jgi:hypothetical protein
MENRIQLLEIKVAKATATAAKAITRAAQREVDVKKAEISLLKQINRQLLNSVYDLRQQLRECQ